MFFQRRRSTENFINPGEQSAWNFRMRRGNNRTAFRQNFIMVSTGERTVKMQPDSLLGILTAIAVRVVAVQQNKLSG